MHRFKTFLLLVSISVLTTANGQDARRLLFRIDTLKSVLVRAGTLSPFDTSATIYDTIEAANIEIAERLAGILTDPLILKFNADSLLQAPALGMTHSKDRRLWIFSWYENTGGTFKSNLNMVHYRTRTGVPRVDYVPGSVGNDPVAPPGAFCSGQAAFYHVYKLKARGRDLYLCMGSGVGCATCIYEIATVVELTKDGINFAYPAFANTRNEEGLPGGDCPASITLGARIGDIEKFSFDPRTQTLTMIYRTDDNTPVYSKKQKRIVSRLYFNGLRFISRQK